MKTPFRISIQILGLFILASFLLFSCTSEVTAKPEKPKPGPVWPVTGSTGNWPIWPQAIEENKINPFEPSPLTPVGRDIIAWVTFDKNGQKMWGEDLEFVLIREETPCLGNVYGGNGWGYFVPVGNNPDGQELKFGSLTSDLESFAVIPKRESSWFMTDTSGTKAPNQKFPFTSEWGEFQQGSSNKGPNGKMLADSGHAWPLVTWKDDIWMAMAADYLSPVRDKSHWDEPWLFLPTNDGTLNNFKITTGIFPQANRYCQVVPGTSFPVAVYQEHLKQSSRSNAGDQYYSRMALLDGPVVVRDIQDNLGNWKRVLIGTTGLGVNLTEKDEKHWLTEGEPVSPESSHKPPTNGHHFGIYALDITDPENPIQLWTITNTHWTRNQNTEYATWTNDSDNPITLTASRPGNSPAFEYCVSRPVIGYTNDEKGNKVWHTLLVGVGQENKLLWLDVNPLTGQSNGGEFTGETVQMVESPSLSSYSAGSKSSSGTTNDKGGHGHNNGHHGGGHQLDNPMDAEIIYPSRILAAYPKEAAIAGQGEPVLSDVYVYLSNGSLYYWNLQGLQAPRKLASFVIQSKAEDIDCFPETNFDIAYKKVQTSSGSRVHTFFSIVVQRYLPGNGSHHDSHTLLVVDLEDYFGDYRNPGNSNSNIGKDIKMQGGEGKGDAETVMGQNPFQVQMENHGSGKLDFEKIASDPVFLNGKLYLTVYSEKYTEAPSGKNAKETTRLYSIDMDHFSPATSGNSGGHGGGSAHSGKPDTLDSGIDYVDFYHQQGTQTFVDSTGTLYLVDASGNVIHSEKILNLGAGMAQNQTASSDKEMEVIYWRER